MTSRGTTLRATALAASAALILSACGGADGDDLDAGGDDGANGGNGGSDGPDVALAGEELNFSYMCIEDPDDPEVLIFSATGTDVDSFDAYFSADDARVSVDVDDVFWEVSGNRGEMISVDVDTENNTASGEATFENTDGEMEDGTFNLGCD